MDARKQKWTPDEDALLKKCVRLGKSDPEIARILTTRSPHSIRYRRKDVLGIDTRHRWTPQEDERLKHLLFKGRTLAEIGKLMNRTESGVERRKERLGLKRIPVKLSVYNPADIAQVVKFKLAGWTHERIAEVFDVTVSYISGFLTKKGFKRAFKTHPKRPNTYEYWTEFELHRLRKYAEKGLPLWKIQQKFQRRTLHSVRGKLKQITRYYLSDEELAERENNRKKQLRVY